MNTTAWIVSYIITGLLICLGMVVGYYKIYRPLMDELELCQKNNEDFIKVNNQLIAILSIAELFIQERANKNDLDAQATMNAIQRERQNDTEH